MQFQDTTAGANVQGGAGGLGQVGRERDGQAAGQAPPSSLTGAQSGQKEGHEQGGGCSLELLVDWASVTFKGAELQDVLSLVEPEAGGWTVQERGLMGYRASVRRGDVVVLYDGAPGMGVHVILSGAGCRQLEAEGVVSEWPAFLARLLSAGGTFTRFDAAIDDRAGLLDLEQMQEAVRSGAYTSRSRKWAITESGQTGNPERGCKLTFGQRGSGTYIRIYDKAAQTGTSAAGPWVRVEIEWREERAQAAVRKLVSEGGPSLAGVLRGSLEFKEAGGSKQKTDWKAAPWWLEFLGHVQKGRLVIAPASRTIAQSAAWVRRQCAPALALLRVAPGYGVDWLAETIEEGAHRLRGAHLAMLEAALVADRRAQEVAG